MFLTFKGGLSTMVDALLTRRLAGRWAQSWFGVPPERSEETSRLRHMKCCWATEKFWRRMALSLRRQPIDAAELLEPHMNVDALRAIRYVSVANVVMAFDKAEFGVDFDGSGFVVPRSEGMTITACTWTSAKWLHSSPGDKVLLRCYVGRSGDEEVVDLPDDQLHRRGTTGYSFSNGHYG